LPDIKSILLWKSPGTLMIIFFDKALEFQKLHWIICEIFYLQCWYQSYILINVFLSLKHQGEKDYLRDRIRLLFYGLEEGEDKYPEKNYIQMLLVYMLCTTDFGEKDWENLMEETPSTVKQLAMSTYDLLIKKGKEQGIELGEEKKAREVVLVLLGEFPEFSDARIAALAKVEEAFVRELRG